MNKKIIKFKELSSTNTYLKELAKKNAPFGTAVMAKKQTNGRGRLDRSFSSEAGGLYLSILLPVNDPENVGLITTYTAVAVARAIEKNAPLSVGIKWVNDLYASSKKLCGILAEGGFNDLGGYAVVGIGINLYNKLPKELSNIATSVFLECGVRIDEDKLAKDVLAEFGDIEKIDFSKNLDEYRHRSIILGKNIEVIPHHSPTYTATALEVDSDGGLVVSIGEKKEKLFSGEISIKIQKDKD